MLALVGLSRAGFAEEAPRSSDSASYRGSDFDGEGLTPDFSTYLVNGQSQGINRNNQIIFVNEAGTFSALGMRFESSYATSRYDEGMVSAANPLDYLIREAVHIRPGVLVVRDLSRRRHSSDTLVARFHLGPAQAVQTIATGHFVVGTLDITSFGPSAVATQFSSDKDTAGNVIGTLLQQTMPLGTSQMELVTVFAEGVTGQSYANGILRLSNNQCVTFASGQVSVATCP